MKSIRSIMTLLMTLALIATVPDITSAGKGNGKGGGPGKGGGGGGGGGSDTTPQLGFRYEITLSVLHDRSTVLPSGLNDYGDVVTNPYWYSDPVGPHDPVLYMEGVEIDINQLIAEQFDAGELDVDPELLDSNGRPRPVTDAEAVNNAGQIAGGYQDDTGAYLAFRYTPPGADANGDPVQGRLQNLISTDEFPNLDDALPRDMNADGDVVISANSIGGRVVYLDGIGLLSTTELENAAGIDAFGATAINDRLDGTVQMAGNFASQDIGVIRYTYNLETGNASVTQVEPVNPSASYTVGQGINKNGDVVGRDNRKGVYEAFLYNSGSTAAQDLGTLGGKESNAVDINDNGEIIGRSTTSGNSSSWESFIYFDGTMYPIRNAIDGAAAFDGFSPKRINNNGQILAIGYMGTDRYVLLLTPYTP